MGDSIPEVRFTVIELLSHVAETVTAVGADVAAPPNHGAQAIIDISVVGGDADETADYHFQGRNLATDPLEDAGLDDDGEEIVAPGVRATQPGGVQVFTQRLRAFRFYRVTRTLDGTTPEFTHGVHVVITDSTRPPDVAQDPA